MPDPNGTFSTAQSLALGSSTTGRVGFQEAGYFDSADYFVFNASQSGSVTVNLTGLGADIDLSVFNGGFAKIGSSLHSGTASEAFTFNVTAGQSYYLEAFPGVTGAASNYTIGTTFQEIDLRPTVTISGSPASNEGGNLVYTVSRTGSTAQALTVAYTLGGSATAGVDYVQPGSMTFAAGSSTGTFTVVTKADQFDDPGTTETVVVNLASGSSYKLGAASTATGTINDTSTGTSSHWYDMVVVKTAVPNLNKGLTTPIPSFMTQILGAPTGPLTPVDQPSLASEMVKRLLVTADIDPSPDRVTVTGIAPAVASLQQIFERIYADHPDLMPFLASAGMLSVRLQRPTSGGTSTAISNHAWGAAIDLKMVGQPADGNPDGKTFAGIAEAIKYFNDAGWVSGSGYVSGSQDDMHFEVSKETLTRWFLSAPAFTDANDTFTVKSGAQPVHARDGNDVVMGTATADVLFGDGGDDWLLGLQGTDTLVGGSGDDSLTGGVGRDLFVFDAALGNTNVDTITDFSPLDDKIHLARQVFAAFSAAGPLASGAFNTGAAASDQSDRIIYNPNTGALIYDSNGTAAGGAAQFATIGTHLALTSQNFLIV